MAGGGNHSVGRFDNGPAYRALLVEQDCPPGHEVIIYRDATPPVERSRIRRIILRELAGVPLTVEETVVLPPAVTLQPNRDMLEQLQILDAKGQGVAAV